MYMYMTCMYMYICTCTWAFWPYYDARNTKIYIHKMTLKEMVKLPHQTQHCEWQTLVCLYVDDLNRPSTIMYKTTFSLFMEELFSQKLHICPLASLGTVSTNRHLFQTYIASPYVNKSFKENHNRHDCLPLEKQEYKMDMSKEECVSKKEEQGLSPTVTIYGHFSRGWNHISWARHSSVY